VLLVDRLEQRYSPKALYVQTGLLFTRMVTIDKNLTQWRGWRRLIDWARFAVGNQ